MDVNYYLDCKKKYNYVTNYKMIFYFFMIIYKLILDISYYKVISSCFTYMGFNDNSNFVTMLSSWIIYILLLKKVFYFFNNYDERISKEMVFVLFIFAFVPFASMIGFNIYNWKFVIINLAYWFLIMCFCCYKKSAIKVSEYFDKNLYRKIVYILTAISLSIVMFISWRYTGFRINIDLSKVYELRVEAQNYSMPTIVLYLFSFTKMTNAILITYYISKRKTIVALMIFLVQLLSFSVDGSKTTIFLALFAFLIGIIPKMNSIKFNLYLLLGLNIIILGVLIYYYIFKDLMPISLITRRTFFEPQRISFQYYDYFSNHKPDLFRQSFLRFIGLKSAYDKPIAFVIAEYYEKDSFSANNGLISDAMANLGYSGVLIMPFIIGILLRVFDVLSKNVGIRIKAIISLYFSVVLSNSFLSTALLTHGLLVTMVILFFISSSQRITNKTVNMDLMVLSKT